MNKQITVYDNTISARTYISYIAEQAGGFACIGRDGKLYIKTIGQDIAELPLKYFKNFKWGEKIKISRIKYEDGIQLFEKGDEIGNTIYINQDNMFIVEQEQINNIYNLYKDLEIYSFEGDSVIDPSLDIGDLLLIDNKYVIYQGSSQYVGKFKASIASKIQCKTKEETMTRVPSQKTINRRIQSEINQIDGTITQLVEETGENSEKLSKVEQDINGITTTIKDSTKDLNEKINIIEQTMDGTKQTLTNKGGNNVFYYAKEFWNNGEEKGIANLEEYTDTEIQQKSVSGNGYIINDGTSEQKQVVKNDNYTISFTYKKLISLATGTIEINGTKYNLTSIDLKEEIITQKIDTNIIDIKIISDTNKAFKIFDLMVSIGNEKQIWTQNPNETRTDTVTIGKGIEVNSDSKNTYARFDADGNRIFNKATGEVVTELTDKGIDTDKVTADEAQIGGVLIQKINNQTWISSLI